MTESEWMACGRPLEMLRHVEGRVSDRKLRLFACAAWRTVRFRVPSDANEDLPTLEAAEGWADGGPMPRPTQIYWIATDYLLDRDVRRASLHFAEPDDTADRPLRAALLRDIVPFRPVGREVAVTLGAPVVRWADGRLDSPAAARLRRDAPVVVRDSWLTRVVRGLAAAAYECRLAGGVLDSARLAVLSDALEDAGCDDQHVLRHLRGRERCVHDASPCDDCGGTGWRLLRGPHVRGCWAIDLVLGKE